MNQARQNLADESVLKLTAYLEKRNGGQPRYDLCLAGLLEHTEASIDFIDANLRRLDNPQAERELRENRKKLVKLANDTRNELRKVRPDLLDEDDEEGSTNNGKPRYGTWRG